MPTLTTALRTTLFIGVLLLLASCSRNPIVDTPPLVTSLETLPQTWLIKAKLGIRTAEDSGSVTLDWQQTDTNYVIKVQGPLGQGNATISGNESHIVIEQPGKQTLYSNNANSLIRDTFGWSLPIHDFKFWVRGIANPDNPIQSADYNPTGVLNSLQQSKWTLQYSRYKPVSQWLLPGRIKAKQDNSQLTLIIREWQLP
ncbi:MAG: lipoprotein insertase outer membrane protein LolB [Cellvibrionaceae bacterium]